MLLILYLMTNENNQKIQEELFFFPHRTVVGNVTTRNLICPYFGSLMRGTAFDGLLDDSD